MTERLPLWAKAEAWATIAVSLHETTPIPLLLFPFIWMAEFTGGYPGLGPKPLPLMVNWPLEGTGDMLRLLITGLGTSNGYGGCPLTPLTVTASGPVLAPVGTVATICLSLQLTMGATTP